MPIGPQHSSAMEGRPRFTNSQYISAVSASSQNTVFTFPAPATASAVEATASHRGTEDAAFGLGVTVGK